MPQLILQQRSYPNFEEALSALAVLSGAVTVESPRIDDDRSAWKPLVFTSLDLLSSTIPGRDGSKGLTAKIRLVVPLLCSSSSLSWNNQATVPVTDSLWSGFRILCLWNFGILISG